MINVLCSFFNALLIYKSTKIARFLCKGGRCTQLPAMFVCLCFFIGTSCLSVFFVGGSNSIISSFLQNVEWAYFDLLIIVFCFISFLFLSLLSVLYFSLGYLIWLVLFMGVFGYVCYLSMIIFAFMMIDFIGYSDQKGLSYLEDHKNICRCFYLVLFIVLFLNFVLSIFSQL